MGTVYYYDQVVIQSGEEPPVKAGSITTPMKFTIDGEIDDRTLTIADDATRVLWEADGIGVSGFKFLKIQADQDLLIDLVVGERTITVHHPAGRPFILFSDVIGV